MKLDIGSGSYPASEYGAGPGWTTVDLYNPDADIKADMGNLPVEDGSVDEIISMHSLEHVPRERVRPILDEWMRVLKPGGRLRLFTPDLDYVCKQWVRDPGNPRSLAQLFGNQTDEGDFHRTGWNASTLRADLVSAGFVLEGLDTVWSHDQQTLRAFCVRPSEPVHVDRESLLPGANLGTGDDRVLVACPTYSGLEYCLDEYLEAYDKFVWNERGLFIVDNTRDLGEYAQKIRDKVEKGDPRRHLRHVEPNDDWDSTFKKCWDLILNHAHFNGYTWVLSLEQDVIIPPLGLDAMLNVAGYTGSPFVTHTYPFHGSRPMLYEGLGCTLMHVDFLQYALETQYLKTPAVEAAIYACAGQSSKVVLRDMFKAEHRDPPPNVAKPWQFSTEGALTDAIGVKIEPR